MNTRQHVESSRSGTRDLRRMNINPHETHQIALRKMRRHLPAPIIPSRNRNGRNTKQWHKADPIRFLIQRPLSEQKVKKGEKHRVASKKDPDLVAHAFWISVMPGDTASIAEQGSLTPICALGLQRIGCGFQRQLVVLPRHFRFASASPGTPTASNPRCEGTPIRRQIYGHVAQKMVLR